MPHCSVARTQQTPTQTEATAGVTGRRQIASLRCQPEPAANAARSGHERGDHETGPRYGLVR
jgi:hypothetical protein